MSETPDPRPIFRLLLKKYEDEAVYERGMAIAREGHALGILGDGSPSALSLIAMELHFNDLAPESWKWIFAHLKACEPQILAALEREPNASPHRMFILLLAEVARGPLAPAVPS
jgi:hypothetical protein